MKLLYAGEAVAWHQVEVVGEQRDELVLLAGAMFLIVGQGSQALIATITQPSVIQRSLECIGLPARPPPLAPAAGRGRRSWTSRISDGGLEWSAMSNAGGPSCVPPLGRGGARSRGLRRSSRARSDD